MALGGGGGFIPEPDLALGGSSGGGGGKRKYSTRMLDDLMVLSRAEGAGDANGEAGASGAAGSTARRPQSQGDAQEAAQAQQQPYSDAGDDALYAELIQLSDTSVALQMLRTQFLQAAGKWEDRPAPVALATQLYAVVENRTAVDRAVDAEARAGRVRRFKLSTGADDYAVMLTADYVQELDRARASFGTSATAPAGSSAANASAIEIAEAELALIGERRASAASAAQAAAPAPAVPGGARGGSGGGRERSATPPPGEAQAGGAGSRAAAGPSSAAGAGKGGEPSPFDLFRDRVLPHAFGLSVTQPELSALLSYCGPPSGAGGPTPVSGPSSISGGSAVVRRPQTAAAAALLSPGGAVSALLTSGFLSRGLQQDSAALWFSFPRGGQLAKAILSGRSVIVAALRKQPMKQMRQREAEKLKIRGSPFPAIFHIRDMVGGQLLDSITTTTGPLLRLPAAAAGGAGGGGGGSSKRR